MRLLVFLFLIGCGCSAWAQLAPVRRLEMPVTPGRTEKYRLLPLGEQGGLIIYHRVNEEARQSHRLWFGRVDTTFQTRWGIEYAVPEPYVPVQNFDDAQYLYYLCARPNSDRIAVFRLSLEEGSAEFYEGEMPSSLDVHQFKVMGNTAYLSGYYRSKPVVLAFSFFDRSFRVFQGLYANNLELGSMEVDPYRQEVHVLTSSPKKRCQFAVRSYSPDGKPLRIIEYDGAQHSLITGKILPVSADESLLVGNYSADCTPYSQGIYITRIHHNETGKLTVTTDRGEAIRYFDFSTLKNFFNYLKPRRQQKLLARVLKRRRLGKDYKFHYRLLVHDLMPTPTGLRVAAEVYYPQSRSNSYGSSFSRNLNLSPLNGIAPYATGPRLGPDRSPAGYQFTHAFICEFDQQGNLVWDNCLPIKELTAMTLTPKMQVLPQDKQVVLAYMKEGETTTQLIERDSVVRYDQPVRLLVSNDAERVQMSNEENIVPWYGPYFVATGYQKIIPLRPGSRLPRDVFYISKLRYDTTPTAPVQAHREKRTDP